MMQALKKNHCWRCEVTQNVFKWHSPSAKTSAPVLLETSRGGDAWWSYSWSNESFLTHIQHLTLPMIWQSWICNRCEVLFQHQQQQQQQQLQVVGQLVSQSAIIIGLLRYTFPVLYNFPLSCNTTKTAARVYVTIKLTHMCGWEREELSCAKWYRKVLPLIYIHTAYTITFAPLPNPDLILQRGWQGRFHRGVV